MAGIYIHIPFCSSKCYYCNFFSKQRFDENLIEKYVDSVCKEIQLQKKYLKTDKIQTIYFGGGTPSILNINHLVKIFDTINKFFDTNNLKEVTIEANPEDLNYKYLTDLKKFTLINRLSIGLQSFFQSDLDFMNRKHTAKQSVKAVELSKKTGFENISVDLIYGLPQMTLQTWSENLKKLFSLDVPHFSAYHLTIEEGTVFGVWQKKGKLKQIDDELSFKFFDLLINQAQKYNYKHYEISNFAKNNYLSLHNFAYWTGKKYLGIGTSANSYDKKSRQWNISNITQYINSLNNGKIPYEKEILSQTDIFNEYIITRLRIYKGLNKKILETKFPKYYKKIKPTLNDFIADKLIYEQKENFILSKKGKFLSDTIMRELIIA